MAHWKSEPLGKRFRIVNKTRWNTSHLAAIIAVIADAELDAEKRKSVVITVENTRSYVSNLSSSGRAIIGGFRCVARIASPRRGRPDVIDFAHVVAHEFAHLRGVKHAQMRGSARYRRVGDWRERYAWAASMPLEPKSPPARVPVDLDAKRRVKLEHAQAKLAEWQRRERLAKNRITKWKRRVVAISRRLAAEPIAASKAAK